MRLINFITVTCKIWRKIGLGHERLMTETETLVLRDRDVDNFCRDETMIKSQDRDVETDHNPYIRSKLEGLLYTLLVSQCSETEDMINQTPQMRMSCKLFSTVKSRLVSPLLVRQPSADQLVCLVPPSALQYDLQSADPYVFHSRSILNLQ